MKAGGAVVGLLIAVAIGYVVYTKSLTSAGGTQAPPQQTIDVTDIRANLLTIAQAERTYLAAHGSYATIDQLNQDGPPMVPTENRGYSFNASPNGLQSFTVTATPSDPAKSGWPTLSIDETMAVKQIQ